MFLPLPQSSRHNESTNVVIAIGFCVRASVTSQVFQRFLRSAASTDQMNISKQLFFSLILVSSIACYKAPSSNSTQAPTSNSSSTQSNASTTSSSVSDYAKAMEAYKAKRYEEAASGFEAVTRSDPKNFDAQLNLGKSYEALKKDDDAVKAYKAAIAIKPEHADANFGAGSIYYRKKSYDAALPYLDQAAKTDYKSPKTLMALADDQRMLKMFDRAIVQYGKVIGFEPNNAEAYYGLGLTYIGLNNKIAAGQQVRKLEPLNKELAKKLADQIGS